LLALSTATATQQPEDRGSCGFKVAASTTRPAIIGPEDIVARTHVTVQPDSPVEILAIDFKDSFLSVANERYTERLRCTMKVRNRSDQRIRGFDIWALPVSGGGPSGGGIRVGPSGKQDLSPGQEMEIQGCGGNGTGSARDNQVRIVVFVNAVEMEDCAYIPSQRYPPRS
jgi:hypothetical protein